MKNAPLFRPPAETDSLILQVDRGCPHNRCTFCGMYRGLPYRRLPLEEAGRLVSREARRHPETQRVFLADGDVMSRPGDELLELLRILNAAFPRLARVSLYANGGSIAAKAEEQLRALQALKLHTLYMGLESGDEDILAGCRKGETAAGMVAAALKAQACGLRMSVMVLLGLGGADLSSRHALHTAEALNRMQPRLLSFLRVIPVPGTELHSAAEARRFRPLTEWDAARELRDILGRLELRSTVLRADHISNVVPLAGRLPHDRERLLGQIDTLLTAGGLDRQSPGPTPLWL